MRTFLLYAGIVLLFFTNAFAQMSSPFTVTSELKGGQIEVNATIPANHYLYSDYLKVTDSDGNEQDLIVAPEKSTILDPASGKEKGVYSKSFVATFAWSPSEGAGGAYHLKYWGCNDSVCFMPQDQVVKLSEKALVPAVEVSVEGDEASWERELALFQVAGSEVGYAKPREFLSFLDKAAGVEVNEETGFRLFLSDPVSFVRESGLFLTLIFILLGGLALNLTPCVLPMIPINLAIIGAGAQAGSRGRGFALGAVYGLGIALAYGGLGVIVVLTGSQFGTIQSNPWFNTGIALIFVALALAMFDLLRIDLSRFQSKLGGANKKQGSFLVAFTMGLFAALLAGACVAPVVIAVLALATSVYEVNAIAGLLLPFVLGIGMALPWPFAGAGLSFLPKPGKWMEYVKYAFGVGIILFALYYGNLAFRGFKPSVVEHGEGAHLIIDGATNEGLAAALKKAHAEGRPVLIDFWASWCKNCKVMDHSTLENARVQERLQEYTFIKYVAEDLLDEETKAVLDHFNVQGLPTFIVLEPIGL